MNLCIQIWTRDNISEAFIYFAIWSNTAGFRIFKTYRDYKDYKKGIKICLRFQNKHWKWEIHK